MSKYKNQPTALEGIIFASKKEANRFSELRLLEKAGLISMLERQPRFPVVINEKLVCTYIADFSYVDNFNRTIVEDVKGFKTPVYKLKKKLVEARYPHIRIIEL